MVTTGAAQATHATALKTITNTQFARQADQICARDYKRQAALGRGLINADKVTRAYLPKAATYLDRIVAITNTEVSGMAALGTTKTGMPQRRPQGRPHPLHSRLRPAHPARLPDRPRLPHTDRRRQGRGKNLPVHRLRQRIRHLPMM
jgi:hypothetical protein